MIDLTPPELEEWLEWAGVRLIAMPGKRVGPDEYRSFWPDFSQETFQILEFRNRRRVTIAPPSSKEIFIVDEILSLPNLCKSQGKRRIIRARTLLHPVNLRRLFPWSRIANGMGVKISSAKYMYKSGLEEICNNIDEQKVCAISYSLLGLIDQGLPSP